MLETPPAVFSPGRTYRYTLTREIPSLFTVETSRRLVVCGLNPSTADEENNDPTISCLLTVAAQLKCNIFIMLNLFAYRATKPKDMMRAPYPVGSENNAYITSIASQADIFIAAWGNHGKAYGRESEVLQLLKGIDVKCFGFNANGTPKHPLYGWYKKPLVTFRRSE